MPKRIVPDVHEISLAFNPANKKKFLMHKDDDKKNLLKGEEAMEKLIKILKDKDLLSDEKAFMDSLKKANVTELKSAEDFGKILSIVMDLVPKVDEKKIREDLEKEIKKTLEPEIRKALEKELKTDDKDKTMQLLKEQVEQLSKDLAASRKDVEVERDARRLSEIKEQVKDMGIPGDVEQISKTMLMAEKTNPEVAKDVMDTFKRTGEILKAAGLFTEIGSSRSGEELGSAYHKLMELKDALMKDNPEMSENDAWRKVCRENTELYKQYTKDHQAKGGMH